MVMVPAYGDCVLERKPFWRSPRNDFICALVEYTILVGDITSACWLRIQQQRPKIALEFAFLAMQELLAAADSSNHQRPTSWQDGWRNHQ